MLSLVFMVTDVSFSIVAFVTKLMPTMETVYSTTPFGFSGSSHEIMTVELMISVDRFRTGLGAIKK